MATNNPLPSGNLDIYLYGLQRHGFAYVNDLGETHVFLPERVPHVFGYEPETYICKGSEYLQDVAVEAFKGVLENPLDAVDIIAQYQEDPIIDVSVKLAPNRVLLIPPVSFIQEVAYGDPLSEFPKIA